MLNSDTNTSQILDLLQLCDSAFPIGSFNHSYGMETYLRNEVIHNGRSFEEWIEMFLKNQFTYNEGLAISLVYDKLNNEEIDKDFFLLLDHQLTVQNVAKESRDGGKLIASRMIDTILTIHDVPLLKEYKNNINQKKCYGNPALVFAIVMIHLQIAKDMAVISYGYSIVATITQNAVRAIPLGQKDGQIVVRNSLGLLQQVYRKIAKLAQEDLGFNIPGFEISQMNHEILDFRLFMS